MASKLTQQQLEAHLAGAADILRGKTAGQDYKTYILTLMFFKRLSDQWDFEAEEAIREKETEFGRTFTDAQRGALLSSGHLHRFSIPEGAHWTDVLNAGANHGEVLTKATKAVALANPELTGVFTVDWNQPAPDGKGQLIANPVVHALIQHFNEVNLSNDSVNSDVLGRAYEYLIKRFADDAGADAGEFFTPPEVVDVLVRCVEPRAGETVYDPTLGAAGMLIHASDFALESGFRPDQLRFRGQELNWSTFAIARINMILHGLEADLRGGKNTLIEPQFLTDRGAIQRFDVVLANFPFSDDKWWISEEHHTKEEIQKAKKSLGKGGFVDKYKRFVFGNPPLSYGDFAFIQHIIASTKRGGRGGVVCPQGVLFRGQPEIEEETDEFGKDGLPKIKRRKADAEHLIRRNLVQAGLIRAVIALPPNIFYGAPLPACLLIMDKREPAAGDGVLFIDASRFFRSLSNSNQLRPQDVMRILVHFHARADADAAADLIATHEQRLLKVVDLDETQDIARLIAEYEHEGKRLDATREELETLAAAVKDAEGKTARGRAEAAVRRSDRSVASLAKALLVRDEAIGEVRRRAEWDRQELAEARDNLLAMYSDEDELRRHARLVTVEEIEDNEFNLSVSRYVDTFEPEVLVDMQKAITALRDAEARSLETTAELVGVMESLGYGD
jgi:type I restriction enzyme M protein